MWNDAHPDFLWFRRFITMALGFFSVRVTVIPVSRFHGTQIQYLLYEYELPYDPRLSIFTVDRPDDTHITLFITLILNPLSGRTSLLASRGVGCHAADNTDATDATRGVSGSPSPGLQ
jgi:hypothetical protein